MNSPFVIDKLQNSKFVVSWPAMQDIQGNPACYNLFKILFDDIKVDYASLFLTSMDNLLTVNSEIWYSKAAEQYTDWLMAQYSIVGVLFENKNHAEQLKEILEKRYMWKILKS